MVPFIALAMLAMPLVEIGLFIWVGGLIGLWPTLALVVLTAMLGLLVLRGTGFALLNRSRQAFAAGEVPGREVADAMLTGVGGALLLVPGFLTDAVGLALLVPAVRLTIYRWIGRNARVVVVDGRAPRQPSVRSIDLDRDDWRAP